ncbi:protein kinase [Sorangium sp. So ce726]|uniref:serine/threonine-protein kinase n=1 Tax=Sorangium sp. So ce726 TaxID=3133319 RepID=UPI003F5DCAA2
MAGDAQPEMTAGESEAAELFHREDIPRLHGDESFAQPPARSDAPPPRSDVPLRSDAPPRSDVPLRSDAPPRSDVPLRSDAPPRSDVPFRSDVPPRGETLPAHVDARPAIPPLPARFDGPARRGKAKQTPRARRCPTCKQTFSGDSRFCPFDGDPLADAPDWNPSADPMLGRTIDGRYEVQAVVGEGGMGTVYEVRHKSLGRLFALKVLRHDIAQDAELVARFIQEAKAAAAIGHPNIVAVSDFGAIEVETGQAELPFFVMEFLSGTSLASLLRTEKTLPADRVGQIMLQCAAALGAAHSAGVIHRDLKPDNVYLVRNGDQEFVKLLDFGVAKVTGGKRLTRIGMVFGTPHYMSPEQAEGKRIDARADIYALGVLMYECFAGRVPFEADTYMGVLTKHMYMSPEPLEQVMPDATTLGAFGPIVMRCLAKNPEERFSSMADLVEAIELALDPPGRGVSAAPGELPRHESIRPRAHESIRPRAHESIRPRAHESIRPRAHEEMLVPVQAPAEPSEPLSMAARVAIALAAVLVPIAIALGVRAFRASAPEEPPEASAADAPGGALPAEPAPPRAVDEPPAVATAAATAAPAPTAQEPPRTQGTVAPIPPKLTAATGRPAATAAPTASMVRPQATGDIVDPWKR